MKSIRGTDGETDSDWLTIAQGETYTLTGGNETAAAGVIQENSAALIFEPDAALRLTGDSSKSSFDLAFEYIENEDSSGELTVTVQIGDIEMVEMDGLWGSKDSTDAVSYRLSVSKSDILEDDYKRNGQQLQLNNLQDYGSQITLVFELGTQFGGGTYSHYIEAFSGGQSVEAKRTEWTLIN